MKWAKTYRDPYTDIKRTSAMSGPWRRPQVKFAWPSIFMAIILGLELAFFLFFRG